VFGDDLAKVLYVAALAAEGFHEQGNLCLMGYEEVEHDLVEVWTMIAAVATGDVNHLFLRFLSTVGATIDMEAGASEMGTRRRPSPRR
jgi:hypothetical protein